MPLYTVHWMLADQLTTSLTATDVHAAAATSLTEPALSEADAAQLVAEQTTHDASNLTIVAIEEGD